MFGKDLNTRLSKSWFAVVPMGNNTIINNQYKNKLFCVLATINLLLPTPVNLSYAHILVPLNYVAIRRVCLAWKNIPGGKQFKRQ